MVIEVGRPLTSVSMSAPRQLQPFETHNLELANRVLTVAKFGSEPIEIVMMHDGLGSTSQWRSLPADIANRCGVGVLTYDRAGHGTSTPLVASEPDWLHTEAEILQELIQHYEIKRPLVVGHSDGGSIGLIHAAGGGECRGIITLAAHSFVEDICVANITKMRANPGLIVIGLARHHDAPKELFDSWSSVWTNPEFRAWDIRADLSDIDCPALVVQGTADDYATDAQLTETTMAIGSNATALHLEGRGHILHHEAPEEILELVAGFWNDLK